MFEGNFSIKEFLGKKQIKTRLVLGLAFWIVVFLFLHFREVRVEFIDLGSPASKYVVAQVDFDFLDKDLKLLMKQESMKDIGDIYHFDPQKVKQAKASFDKKMIDEPSWRSRLEGVTFQQIYDGSDFTENAISNSWFASNRTIRNLAEFDYPKIDEYYLLDASKSPAAPDEAYFDNLSAQIEKKFDLSSQASHFIVDDYKSLIGPLSMDSEEKIRVEQYLDLHLPQVYSKVGAGSQIVATGELVTKRHLAQLQAMKHEIQRGQNLFDPANIAATIAISLMIVAAGALYLRRFHTSVFQSGRELALLLSIITVTLAIAKACDFTIAESTNFYLSHIQYPILIPLITLLASLLMGPNIAYFVTFITTVLLGMSLAVEHSRFLILNMIAAIYTLYLAQRIKRRKEIFTVCIKVFLFVIPVLVSYAIIDHALISYGFFVDLVSSAICLLMIAMLVVTLLPIFESFFNVMTDMSLMEWLDPSIPLLRRLSVEAPGTYQHSMGVSYLAEVAAASIGANALFCRVASLYHDIGKIISPNYFAENLPGNAFDVHKLLRPLESASIIMNHVPEGEILARKHKLPEDFIKIIREHHGTTLVHYFYCKQVELNGGDVDGVDAEQFRYKGPKPQTIESVIIMIADSLEASSRSFDELDFDAAVQLVEKLVSDKMDEGQFSESTITFKQLESVKTVMAQTIFSMYHRRPKYPKGPSSK